MKKSHLIALVVFIVLVSAMLLKNILYVTNHEESIRLVSYYPESVTIEQGKQKMTVDGLQMTQFVLSGVRVIVNGDTLRNVNCEMVKID